MYIYSVFCFYFKGVVCWNFVEKSFDCLVYGSCFFKEGICVIGFVKVNLLLMDKGGEVD